MSEDLTLSIKKAEGYLSNAQVLVVTSYPAGAITASYYCFFWLVRGLLADKDVFTKRHSAAREMFSLHFIKPGKIPTSFKDDFNFLFEHRQIADYDADGDFPLEEIEKCVALAERFLIFVKTNYAS
jgi:uncharacterized protein (UPF0332 family)